MSKSLQPYGMQHVRLPCPSLSPRACSNSCPLCRWCHPTISSSVTRALHLLSSVFPSIRVFSRESGLWIRWPKCWSFSISPSSEYARFISFRMDCFDLLAVQGTLKSLLQHHSSKASVLQCSAFFMVQLSHPHMTTGKTIALTKWTFLFFTWPQSWTECMCSPQIHAYWVSDAIQPSHPLPHSSLFAFNLSKCQDLLQWAGSLHQVAKVLELQLQHQSFQWIFRVDIL